MPLEIIKSIEDLPPEYRWRTALACVKEMIRIRRDPELSEAVIQTDPRGERALTLERALSNKGYAFTRKTRQ